LSHAFLAAPSQQTTEQFSDDTLSISSDFGNLPFAMSNIFLEIFINRLYFFGTKN